MTFRRPALALTTTALAALLSACGTDDDANKAQVRLVNASGYSTLSLAIDDDTVASNIGWGGTDSYTGIDAANTTTTMTTEGSATTLLSATVALDKKHHYSMLAWGKKGALAQALLDDETTTPSSGKASVRILNGASDAGSLDVYLTAETDSLASATPVQSSAAYGSLGSFNTVTSGTWRLRVTAAGNRSDVRLDASGLSLTSQSVHTLVISPASGGVLVHALDLPQQSSLAKALNPQSRVRAVAGLAGSAAVSASVGSTALLAAVAAPALTGYSLLTAGTLSVSASSNTSSTVGSASFTGGADYTLLVWGSASLPNTAVIADDNSRPALSTNAKLRLVNGSSNASGSLLLKVNYTVTASGVTEGTASSYTELAAATTPQLDVVVANSAVTLCSINTKDLVANGVYSLFVLGDATAPNCVLSADR